MPQAQKSDPEAVIKPDPEVITEEFVRFPDGSRATRTDLEPGSQGGDAPEMEAFTEAQKADAKAKEPGEAEPSGDGSSDSPGDAGAKDATKGDAGDADAGDGDGDADADPDAGEEKRGKRRKSRRDRKNAARRRDQEMRDTIAKQAAHIASLEAAGGSATDEGEGEPPKMDDFEDPEKFITQAIDFRLKQRDKTETTPLAPTPDEIAAQAEAQESAQQLLDDGGQIHDDFAKVVQANDLTISPEMAEYFYDSDDGPEMAYYLGSNKDEARTLSGMTGRDLDRALVRLEAKVQRQRDAAPPARRTTKAPEPITPVAGGDSGGPKTVENMTQDQYNAMRRKERNAQGLF